MAGNPIAKLFAELGFKVNRHGLKQFESDLKKVKGQVDSPTGLTGSYKKATKSQNDFFRSVTRGYGNLKPNLRETWQNLDRIKEGFRQGQLTQEQFNNARRRSLERISQLHKKDHAERMRQLKAQERAARRATRANDPRQVGNHRLISAIHSDTGLGLMIGGFAAAQSSRSFQEFVGMQQGLTAATGSTERAAEEMEYLLDLSRRLGLFVGDLGRSFSSFAAAAKGSALTSQEVRDTFEGIASQARVLNLSAADTEGVMRSLTQMMNKGTIMAEELKNQMGERLPGSMQSAARAAHNLGITQEATTQALFKAMEQGQLMADEFLPELANELMKTANSGGALEAAMNSTGAAIGRFRTNVFLANKTFNESGFDKSIRDLMNTLSDAIMKAEPLWIALGKISEFVFFPLRAGIELFGSFAQKLGLVGDMAEGNETKIKLFGLAVASLFRWSRKLLAVFLLIPAAFSGVSKLLDGEQLTWQEWALTLAGIAASLGMILSTLTRIKGIRNAIGGSASTGTSGAAARPTPIASSDWSRSGSSTIWQRLGQSVKSGARGPGFLPIGVGSAPSEEEFVRRSQEVPWWDLIGRLEAKQAEINNRGNTVQGDININIEGNDPLQIGGEVERVINGIFRDSSMNEPSTEK